MVTVKTIETIINKIIKEKLLKQKCGRYSGMISSLPLPVKKTLNDFNQNDARELDHEQGILILNNGKIVASKDTNDEGDEDKNKVGIYYTDVDDKIINDGEKLHIDHNHIEAYKNAGESNISTCLGIDDIKKITLNIGDEENFNYVYASITADCSNGSRMSLVVIDESKFHRACNTLAGNGKSLIDNANYNLQVSYFNEAIPSIENRISETMDTWKSNKIKQLQQNNEIIDLDSLNEESSIHRMKVQKLYYKQEFENFFQDNIEEFKELGLELTMGWVKDK